MIYEAYRYLILNKEKRKIPLAQLRELLETSISTVSRLAKEEPQGGVNE